MAKYLLGIGVGEDPVFDASAKTVTLDSEFVGRTESPIDFIINNTTNKLIYKKGKTGHGGTWDKTNAVLTLEYDTSADGSADTDTLHAWVNNNDGRRGVDFASQMYVDNMIAANNDETETKLAAVEAKLETMRSEQNTKLDKLAEIPDSIIVETSKNADGKEVQIVDNSGTKEVHVVTAGATATPGDAATRVAYSDLIVAVKGIEVTSPATQVDVKLSEGGVVKVPTFPLAQADNIDARADKLLLDKQTSGAAVGGKVQITLVKE